MTQPLRARTLSTADRARRPRPAPGGLRHKARGRGRSSLRRPGPAPAPPRRHGVVDVPPVLRQRLVAQAGPRPEVAAHAPQPAVLLAGLAAVPVREVAPVRLTHVEAVEVHGRALRSPAPCPTTA